MKITHGSDKMSINKYRAFVTTVKLGSLTKAASVLGSTQSRISHVLADLESAFGFTLMERGRSGISLTEAGERLLPLMEEILEREDALRSLVESIREGRTGSVRIGTFSSVAVRWLPGMIQSFQQKYSGIELQMLSGDYSDIDQWLQNGDIDIGFVTLPAPERMKVIPLLEDPLMAILPKGHPLAEKEQVPVEQLRHEPFISLRQSSNQDIIRALDTAGVKPSIRYSTKDDYALIAMVRQGLGVSIVPELLLENHRDAIEARKLIPPVTRTIALAIPKDDPSPAVMAFVDSALQWLQDREASIM